VKKGSVRVEGVYEMRRGVRMECENVCSYIKEESKQECECGEWMAKGEG
jgi:hypothetical protein